MIHKKKCVKTLYIGGAGRSGSTLLEMILGNVPGFFSVGEVRFFWQYILRDDIMCGCGEMLRQCPFWKDVTSRLAANHIDFERLAILNHKLNRTRNLPRITRTSFIGAANQWRELVSATKLLYQEIENATGNLILVDSSKVPSQFAILRQAQSVDLRLLHLVRDGRAVAYSWNKRQKAELAIKGGGAMMPRHSMFRSMLTWSFENSMTLMMSHHASSSVLRYEDFVQNPYEQIALVLGDLGFSGIDISFLENSEFQLQPTHSVGGNPV